jgi:hypothetical protein
VEPFDGPFTAKGQQFLFIFFVTKQYGKKVEITQAGEFSYIFLGRGEISSPVGKRKVRLIFITNLLSLSNRKCVSDVIDLPPGSDVNVIFRRV